MLEKQISIIKVLREKNLWCSFDLLNRSIRISKSRFRRLRVKLYVRINLFSRAKTMCTCESKHSIEEKKDDPLCCFDTSINYQINVDKMHAFVKRLLLLDNQISLFCYMNWENKIITLPFLLHVSHIYV